MPVHRQKNSMNPTIEKNYNKFPNDMKIRLKFRTDDATDQTTKLRSKLQTATLHTVCQEASCPNLSHCWSQGTATFMILGSICTRRCGFCNVDTGKPQPPDPDEPQRLAEMISKMRLKHAVITSVDRDDLADCGSGFFGEVIETVRARNPFSRVEVLVPDFKARIENLINIWRAEPTIISHNVETVPSLHKEICPQSSYKNSLRTLELSGQAKFLTKSGIILGLGETQKEVESVIDDLIQCGVKLLTIGQYLQPSPNHATLQEYVPASLFRDLKEYALMQGMGYVESGPLVRSSYHAAESLEAYLKKMQKTPAL